MVCICSNLISRIRIGKEEKMTAVSDEMNFFRKLMEPLVTNKTLEVLFKKLKDDIVKGYEENILEQNSKPEKLKLIVLVDENIIH